MVNISTRAHYTKYGEIIEESAICTDCEGNAGYRMKSWMNAKLNSDYNESSRDDAQGHFCQFCWRASEPDDDEN